MKQFTVEVLAVLVVIVLFSNMNGTDVVETRLTALNETEFTGERQATASFSLSDEVIQPVVPDAVPFPAPRLQRG